MCIKTKIHIHWNVEESESKYRDEKKKNFFFRNNIKAGKCQRKGENVQSITIKWLFESKNGDLQNKGNLWAVKPPKWCHTGQIWGPLETFEHTLFVLLDEALVSYSLPFLPSHPLHTSKHFFSKPLPFEFFFFYFLFIFHFINFSTFSF